jgi:DNA-binding CsgD family transcriptional regulator
MDVLRQRLSALLAGRGGLVLIAGEAGIGKTALVDWFAAEAAAAGVQVLAGYGINLAQTPPYGPWRDALAGLMLTDGSSVDNPLISADAVASQSDLFDRVRADLARAGAHQPLAIVLEDLHWSDPASLELLHAVARDVRLLPLLLIATYRDDEVSPREPLFALLPRLAREPAVERLALRALDDEATRALIRQRYDLAASDEARLVTYLLLRAEGNPLFVTELLRTLETERLLALASGGWYLGELSHTPVPPLVRQIIEERLARLPEETQSLLEIAAAIGQEAPLDTWNVASAASRDDLLTAAERAVGAHLVRGSSLPAHLTFTHALVRDAVYGRQPLLARQMRHRRIAEVFAARPDATLSVVASHFSLADDPRAIDWLVRTGEQALALYAARDALLALDHAQELATRYGETLPIAAYRARATAASLLGEFDLARRDYELALDRARAMGDHRAEWQALVDLGMLWAERDYERTGGYYRSALDLARETGDAAMLAYSLNRVANWYVNLDEPDIGIPLHEEALALFTAADDRAGIADTLDYLGMSSYLGADFARGTHYCERAVALFRERNDQQRLSSALVALSMTGGDVIWTESPLYREPGYWMHAGEEALAIAREIGWSAGEAFALMCLSMVAVTRGDLGRAFRDAEAGLGIALRIGHQQWILAARQAVATAWIEALEPRRAVGELEQALTAARVSGSRFWTTAIAGTLASLHISRGELSHAAALLGDVLRPTTGRRSLSQRQCRFVQAELLLARNEPAHALTVIEELFETRAPSPSGFCLPLLFKVRGEALARIDRVEEAEHAYLTAREDAVILEFRPLLWRIEAALSRLYSAQGRMDEATDARQRARAIIGWMADTIDDHELRQRFRDRADAILPTLLEPAATLPREPILSPRELDVLRHLVEGKSDREIAAALFISPRTVMRHVAGILTKLNVPSRTAAATLAVREAIV